MTTLDDDRTSVLGMPKGERLIDTIAKDIARDTQRLATAHEIMMQAREHLFKLDKLVPAKETRLLIERIDEWLLGK